MEGSTGSLLGGQHSQHSLSSRDQDEPATTTGRQGSDHRADQARKLMQRLDKGDGRLALLLNQMADALSALLQQSEEVTSKAAATAAGASNREGASQGAGSTEDVEETVASLSDFEDLAQDWLASVYDIQLTLRKAIRFLVLASQPPVLTASHSFVHGGGVTAASAGKASSPYFQKGGEDRATFEARRERSVGDNDSLDRPGELSLSALRIKHRAWSDLIATLRHFNEHKQAPGDDPAQGAEGLTSKDSVHLLKSFQELMSGQVR
ncbi:unnamed protein product [Parajaminaea phylloscopi]